MLSKIRKIDTEKLKKYLLINDQCFSFALVALVAVLMFLGIPSIFKFIDGIVTDIVIPIVWTIIYIAFAIVLILWQLKSDLPKSVIIWLVINGVLNVLWCLFFFTLHLTFVGNITIVLNLIAGFVLFVQIDKYKPLYAYVIALYPVWLSLATTLNLALWILN